MNRILINRVILIVLDGLGIGELPDAGDYGDEGSNTLANMARAVEGISLPNLEQFGLGYLGDFKGIGRVQELSASFGRMKEASKGKDTTTGHWEIAGIILDRPFPVYHEGFPPEIIKAFKKKIGKDILGNIPASGTEIIKELGEEHMRTGFPIVYTSADSVFQIAAHEEVIPLEELYKICEIARGILKPPHNVCRVIARPFTGKPGSFERTPRRKDFSIKPPEDTLLDKLSKKDFPMVGIGKIWDLFAGKGVTKVVHTKNNIDGVDKLLQEMEVAEKGLIFINLIDFDTLYGHRNDSIGYARGLKEFDNKIPELLGRLRDDDLLIITADHGCDPTTPSTDHSREYVPVLVYGKRIRPGIDLGTRESFADLGQTIAEAFGLRRMKAGRSFWKEIKR